MKEYILKITFNNWQNQLFFMSNETPETGKKWKEALSKIEKMKEKCKEEIEYQNKVIEYLQVQGFIRIQK